MAQHINNQLHQMANLPMLQGLNFTILNNQQHHLGQFGQPGQNMYQIVQQVQPGQHQVQLQNVQHQFNQQFHHMQPQQFNQQQNILVQQQNQQIQQQNQQLQQSQQQQQIQHQQQIQQQQQQQQMQQQQQQQQTNNSNNSKNNNSANNKQELTKSGKKKRPKMNKEGVPAPKRATTAYINFTQYYREQIKKTGRSVPKIGEFGKECAGKWNSMTEEEKKPFTDEAEKDRERYRKEMEIFKPQRDANKPKRPGTAFMLFMVDFRKEVAGKEPEGGVAALAKLGGERWRNMTDEEKKPYCQKQNEQKMIYELEMAKYREMTGQAPKIIPNSSKTSASVKSEEDSNASEQLNNSLSNSNISNANNGNMEKLNNHDEQSHNHNSQSPGSTLNSDPSQSLPSIATTISLQSQPFYSTANTFMSTAFLDQQHEDASYSQTIDQQIDQQLHHDGQHNQEQNEQAYLQNGGTPTYQHYGGWN